MSKHFIVHPTFRILSTEPGRLSYEDRISLGSIAPLEEIEADRQYLLDNVNRYQCLFIGLKNVIDEEILAQATQLKCIVSPTTGLSHIDVKEAEKRHVTVLSLRGETTFLSSVSATAELTWGLLLALVRRIPAADRSVRHGNWDRDRFYGNELRGRTLGIVGFGRLGKMISEFGRAFGMNVVMNDISSPSENDIRFLSLDDLLECADVVSVNASLNESTKGLLGKREFNLMKPGALLINTSRGEILDEAALLNSLETGRLAGAAIDVMAGETSLKSRWLLESDLYRYLLRNDNLIITPHIGGVTHESVSKTNKFMINKLRDYLARSK
jgi:D-3-phosphoglycerate dehydrogenase